MELASNSSSVKRDDYDSTTAVSRTYSKSSSLSSDSYSDAHRSKSRRHGITRRRTHKKYSDEEDIDNGSAALIQFFNRVVAQLASVGIIMLVYLNYLMFELYLGEFISSFIFCEALWDTKENIKSWFDTVENISIANENGFSLKREALLFCQICMEKLNPRKLNPLNTDSSVEYIYTGILITALVLKPEYFFWLLLIAGFVLLATLIFGNKLLVFFRLHRYLGITNDTFAAISVLLTLTVAGLSVGALFVLMVYRDLKLINGELAFYVEEQFADGWAGETVQEYIPYIKTYLQNSIVSMESDLEGDESWKKLAVLGLKFFDSFNKTANEVEYVNQSAFEQTGSCVDTMSYSFGEVKQQLSCLWVEASSIIQPQLFDSISAAFPPAKTVLVLTASISIIVLDTGIRLAFFVTLLFLQLCSKETVLQSTLPTILKNQAGSQSTSLFEKTSHQRHLIHIFEIELRKGMENVLLLPAKWSLLNSFGTMFVCWIFDIRARFLCASLVMFFTLFPLITPYWLIAPWLIFYSAKDSWSLSRVCFVFIVHYGVHYVTATWVLNGMNRRTNRKKKKKHKRKMSWINQKILNLLKKDINVEDDSSQESQDTESSEMDAIVFEEPVTLSGKREYVTSLSMFFGLVTFGPKGVVTGPFLFCLSLICHKIYTSYRDLLVDQRLNENSADSGTFTELYVDEPLNRRASEQIRRVHSEDVDLTLPESSVMEKSVGAKSDDESSRLTPQKRVKSIPVKTVRFPQPSSMKRSKSAGFALNKLGDTTENGIVSIASGVRTWLNPSPSDRKLNEKKSASYNNVHTLLHIQERPKSKLSRAGRHKRRHQTKMLKKLAELKEAVENGLLTEKEASLFRCQVVKKYM